MVEIARRVGAAGAVLAATGCARVASVDIAMTGRSELAVVPREVELQHEKEGWIRVDLAPRSTSPGQTELATADLPKGRYEAIRLVYDVSPGDREVRESRGAGGVYAERPGGAAVPKAEREEATLWQPFCIRSGDDEIVLRLVPHDPASSGTLQVDVRAPEC